MIPKLSLKAVSKTYPGAEIPAVDAIDLQVGAGETLALLGPSGCGKSTTLNMIVGLERPGAGRIEIDGRDVTDQPAGQRNVGLVFQDYAVFTSMTVRQNLAFGLAVRRQPRAAIARAVDEVAELLGMSDRLEARAADLGGSEMQRIAIGRTLVTRPAILLLDEPLSNLESAARLAMRRELRRLQKEIGLTIVYVTHDQIEALSLADRIAVMQAGRIRQIEAATRILSEPAHSFVASFLGEPPMTLLPGTLRDGIFEAGALRLPLVTDLPAGALTLGLRPQALRITAPEGAALSGTLRQLEPRGPEAVVTLDCAGRAIKVVVPSGTALPEPGQRAGLAVPDTALVAFDGDTNLRLSARIRMGEAA
ncbi:ATP-binding cassette domain-containing protein [Pseudooceanicola sp. GBMRC 2024]|uniref:ATP-binding cassette domain-containing protein n=1 Tax=Pseudooceanicola albus TaxID=2692189 RepID=A0A6L7G2X9_9RHOB|nr:ABC transporter ATP-binding protein [Pseudooceanicola albus]MXN17817.1 ATP-binding cassette domain-containing protein [Pseudooceanicola albus]